MNEQFRGITWKNLWKNKENIRPFVRNRTPLNFKVAINHTAKSC